MTITANDNIESLWNLACTLPTKTGGRTRSQKSALKQLVTVPGGLVFIVTRKEIEELQRRGIWPTNLDSIARAVAGLELQGRRLMRGLAGVELQRRQMLRKLAAIKSEITDNLASLK